MRRDFGKLFWIHLFLIICAWSSPLWADWKLILLGAILLGVQYAIIGGCHLTFLETGKEKDITFYYHYLSKLYPSLSKKWTKVFARYILPVVLMLIALILQTVFDWNPALSL